MTGRSFARAALLAAALILPALALSACNTIEGAGQDIKNAGQWIEKKAGGENEKK